MIYIIVSNIGLAIITIVMFVRYSHFRISSNLKISALEKSVKIEKDAKIEIEKKLRDEMKSEVEQVKSLLREIEELRKEKSIELKLRLEAEKQIALSLQKIQDVQKRVNDWKVLQDAAMRESKDQVVKIGEDIFNKISRNYKDEVKQNKVVIEDVSHKIEDRLEKMQSALESFKKVEDTIGRDVNNVVKSSAQIKSVVAQVDDYAKNATKEVVSLAEVSGLKPKENYIIAKNLDESRAKFLLCDVVLLVSKTLYLVDFKAIRHLRKFDEAKDKNKALLELKPNLDKYISYISNEKYKTAVKKIAVELKMPFEEMRVVFGIKNQDDYKALKDAKYVEKINDLQIQILDINGVNDLIL